MLSLFFSSSESVGEPYLETLQITNIIFNLKMTIREFAFKTQLMMMLFNLQHVRVTDHTLCNEYRLETVYAVL